MSVCLLDCIMSTVVHKMTHPRVEVSVYGEVAFCFAIDSTLRVLWLHCPSTVRTLSSWLCFTNEKCFSITTICHHHLSRFIGSSQCSYSGTVNELIFPVFAWENKSWGYIMSVWIHAADRSHLFPACNCFLPVCANILCVFSTMNELDTSTLCILVGDMLCFIRISLYTSWAI